MGMSDIECEATVVAGNTPEAPPVPPKPSPPAGTPVVAPLPLSRRPRRNRRSPVLRAAIQETSLSPSNLAKKTPRLEQCLGARLGWRHGLVEEVSKAQDVGVNSIVLFPKIPDALKTSTGDGAYNENGVVPRTIRLLKDKYRDLLIYTDVALDPYSSDGHDGIVREDGVIMNDETVHQPCKQAVTQVKPGLPYLDIIRLLRDNSPLPIAAYQVSGVIKAGGVLKMIDKECVMMESLMSQTGRC